jgi:hypothetical protein
VLTRALLWFCAYYNTRDRSDTTQTLDTSQILANLDWTALVDEVIDAEEDEDEGEVADKWTSR